MNFLFWNIKKRDSFLVTICEVVKEEHIDVIAFVEFPDGKEFLFETELQKVSKDFKYLKPILKNKVVVFYKDGVVNINSALTGERISINRIISSVDKKTYLFVTCHAWSKLFIDSKQQPYLIPTIVKEIEDFETNESNKNTIVCGDFNMDAFEDGMLLNNGFNAMMTAGIANRRTRRVQKQDFNMFYNPMWGLYGDIHGNDVAGTYYYKNTSYRPVHQYWHMLDQVIMRPDVIPIFDKTALKIVYKGKAFDLLDGKGIINSKKFSDHLPIKFKLNI